jgi:hypothetical protein
MLDFACLIKDRRKIARQILLRFRTCYYCHSLPHGLNRLSLCSGLVSSRRRRPIKYAPRALADVFFTAERQNVQTINTTSPDLRHAAGQRAPQIFAFCKNLPRPTECACAARRTVHSGGSLPCPENT